MITSVEWRRAGLRHSMRPLAAAAQTARTSASRLMACSSSQQTAASHAADACVAISCAPPSRPATLWGSTRSRSGTSTCVSSGPRVETGKQDSSPEKREPSSKRESRTFSRESKLEAARRKDRSIPAPTPFLFALSGAGRCSQNPQQSFAIRRSSGRWFLA